MICMSCGYTKYVNFYVWQFHNNVEVITVLNGKQLCVTWAEHMYMRRTNVICTKYNKINVSEKKLPFHRSRNGFS